MKHFLCASLLVLAPFTLYAENSPSSNLSPFFNNKNGCFILYDLTNHQMVTEYNAPRCATRIPADSTFKVALSLMAFDQKLIEENSIFIWDKKDKGLAAWNQNQTPQTWIHNSTVWVSQLLTPQLGLPKIKSYLQQFNYGNQDFSGNPGKHDGLTQAWLNSSLKISAQEQLTFLEKLDQSELPVSKTATRNTLLNMYLETSPQGWKLFGKTGTGDRTHSPNNTLHSKDDGWFIGYVTKGVQTYVFVLNFTDTKAPETTDAGGTRARAIAKKILNKMQVF